MAHYLFQCSYTAEAWASLVQNPRNRLEAVRSVVEKLGGSMENGWTAFGEYDVVAVLQMPDNVSVAGLFHGCLGRGCCEIHQDHPPDVDGGGS